MNFAQLFLILRARKGLILKVLFTVVFVTVVLSLLMPKTYKASTSLVMNFKGTDALTGLALPAQLTPGYMPTQVDIINSKAVALKAVDALKLAQSADARRLYEEQTGGVGDFRDWLAQLLLKKIDVVLSRDSNVLEITYKNSDPQFAAAVANAFANAYQQVSIDLKVAPSQQASSYFADEIKRRREAYDEAQRKMSKYQEDNGIVNTDNHYDVENTRLGDLSTQLVMAQAQAMEATSRRAAASGPGAGESPDVANNTLIQTLKANLGVSESKLAQLSQRLGTKHPDYLSAKADADNLRAELNRQIGIASNAVGNNASVFVKREAELRAAVAAQKAKVLDLNRKRDELSVLQRELDSAQDAYKTISQRATQVNLDVSAVQSDIGVLSVAYPPQQAWAPKIPLNIILSLFVGTFLGVLAALVLELLNRRVRSVADMQGLAGGPVLGVIERAQKSTLGKRRFWQRRKTAAVGA
ncbi:chain length determinant protein EpsF [Herbaspirillum sp. YR522]|uniref:chain length determinant protein EpsF n=1 Tax=Herbaspirillum sp. YR522 TaxID=1144342 RepID=UPI00026F7F4D|nr:chain length determinant protein EpsF [Herbaspirillum sp. YR522]EJN08101.1 chain length determinant protein EpsF [Herbaspirillum sp. YR522]